MIREELIFVATCDISGHVRGKGFPARELPARLKKGVGWTGSNLMMSPSGPIWDTPFGTAGDLMIVPDPAVEVRVDFGDGSAVEHFFLGDICTTDGAPWECCPRDFLRRAVDALAAEAGLAVMAGFEQEFVYDGIAGRPGDAYALSAFRRQGAFGEVFMAALAAAGVGLDTFLAEYGARQFEVTVAPAPALTAADHAVITREMARAAAFRLGHRVSFSPKPDPEDVGNGVHIHFSLWDKSGRPMTHTPGETMDLAPAAQHFCAGILHHLPAICAVTAPSPVSYLRLVPNRWAPTAIDLVRQDRGACLRICPVFAAANAEERARQFHLEFRATDAAASPYLALGAVIFAGTDGIRRKLPLPAPGTPPRPLPRSLPEALDGLAASAAAQRWFGPTHMEAYLRFKRVEAEKMAGLSAAELCARYAEIY
jgi:glutamine synthetase